MIDEYHKYVEESNNKYITIKEHPDDKNIVILNYTENAVFERRWNNETMSSRGLILDLTEAKNNGIVYILARPFSKFFNYGENSEYEKDIDFSTLQKDEKAYYWNESEHRSEFAQFFGSNTTLESIRPASLSFNYATEFVKKVPVFVNIEPNFVVGYDLETTLKSQPDSIAIVGPKQYLEDINKISTQKITLNAVKKDIETTVELDVSNYPKYLKFSKTKVLVTGKVDKFTEGKIAVPVHLVNLPEHLTLSVFPKEIPVVFYTSLSAYNSIDRNDFRIECDYNTLDLSSNVMIPKLVLYPKSAKMAELQINSLEYVITKKND